ncbi:hypothetical protein V6251_07590 [Olleya sp. Ti.3.14]|uniref:hypothetical protein n=1 Tax=Olleya sp. Ti.3.14 TaxID=3121297 RepID=UPI00311D2DF3
MKKNKYIKGIILVFCLSLLTVGCTTEKTETDDTRTDLSLEESLKIDRKGVLSFQNNNYIIFKDNKIRKFNNGNFDYDIISDLKTEVINDKKNEDYTITLHNSLDNTETLTYFNFEVIDGNKLNFSVLASNGVELNNLTFESETILTSTNTDDKNPALDKYCWTCIEIIAGLVLDSIIDAVTSTGSGIDMTKICLEQIKACFQSGGTPTNMQASSSFFGGESCSLDCIPN